MSGKKAWGLVACLMAPLYIGCTSANTQGIVRSQNPNSSMNRAHQHIHEGLRQTHDGLYQTRDRLHRSADRLNNRTHPYTQTHHGPIVTRTGPGWVNTCCGDPGCTQCGGGTGQSGPACAQCGSQCDQTDKNGSCLCKHCGPGPTWYPTHMHWFTYEEPRDLVYPPTNVPPAVVQYPYYTLKGPNDFFQK